MAHHKSEQARALVVGRFVVTVLLSHPTYQLSSCDSKDEDTDFGSVGRLYCLARKERWELAEAW